MGKIPQMDLFPRYGVDRQESKGLRKLILAFLPLHAFMHMRTEIPLIRVRWKGWHVRRRYRNSHDLLVNLGSGRSAKPGWVNVDVSKGPLINCVYDCRKSLPFPDASVRGIVCEHFFEHVDYTEEVPYFLSECHRVLKKDGVLRLVVPDVEKYLRAYCRGGWDDLSKIRPLDAERTDVHLLCKYNTRIELINLVFRQGHEHKFAYDFETLDFVLNRYGFSEIVRQEYKRSLVSELCLDQADRASESLYVDARK